MSELTYLRRKSDDMKYHIVPEERAGEQSGSIKSACGRQNFTRTTEDEYKAWLITQDLCRVCRNRLADNSGEDEMLRRLFEMADEWETICRSKHDMSPEKYEKNKKELRRKTERYSAKKKARDLFD